MKIINIFFYGTIILILVGGIYLFNSDTNDEQILENWKKHND